MKKSLILLSLIASLSFADINITNNDGSSSNVVLNNSTNNVVKISNNGKVTSNLEVKGGHGNDISITNNESVSGIDGSLIAIFPILIFVGLLLFLGHSKKIKKEDVVEKVEEIILTDFEELKKELMYLISKKINSDNLKDRILGIIEKLEKAYNDNNEIITKLKHKKNGISELTAKNKSIIVKMKDLLDKIDIESADVDSLDETNSIINYIEAMDKYKKDIL